MKRKRHPLEQRTEAERKQLAEKHLQLHHALDAHFAAIVKLLFADLKGDDVLVDLAASELAAAGALALILQTANKMSAFYGTDAGILTFCDFLKQLYNGTNGLMEIGGDSAVLGGLIRALLDPLMRTIDEIVEMRLAAAMAGREDN